MRGLASPHPILGDSGYLYVCSFTCFFSCPCTWQSLVRCWSCLRCSGFWYFPGDDFRFVSVFSAQLGSTVDTCIASVYVAFWKNLTLFSWWFPGDDFRFVSVFSAMLGPVVHILRQSTE